MKNSSDTTGIRTRDLPSCSTVPRPTAPQRIVVNIIPANVRTMCKMCRKLFVHIHCPTCFGEC